MSPATFKDNKYLSVKKLLDEMEFEILFKGDLENKKIETNKQSVSKIEIIYSDKPKVIAPTNCCYVFNEVDLSFFDNYFDVKTFKNYVKKVCESGPALLLFTEGYKQKWLEHALEVIKQYDIPAAMGENIGNEAQDFTNVLSYVTEAIAPKKVVHACLVSVYGIGVLIRGNPNIGKSETTIELIKNNHLFVGDDSIFLYRLGHSIIGKCNPLCEGYVELHGVGLFSIRETFGQIKIIDRVNVNMVVDLQTEDQFANKFRLGENRPHENFLGIKIPVYKIPVTPGRKASDLIELAAADYKLKKEGFDLVENFIKSTRESLKRGKT